MELDFSKLFSDSPGSPQTGFIADKERKPVEQAKSTENAPQEATGGNLGRDPAADPVEVVRQIREKNRRAADQNAAATMKLERLQSAATRYREAYKEYQDNIKKSEVLRAQITKGAKAGEDPANLLLQAVECIAAMTGDPYYLENFKAIIGTESA